MNSAHLIARLVAANAPADLIADLAMALARGEAAEQQASERRAKDRARKSVPRNSTESTEFQEQPSSLDKETPPRPPKEINLSTRGSNALPRKAGGFPAPDGVSHEIWVAFCQQRKKPVTKIAYTAMLNKMREAADAGWPPGPMFERAIESGYETIFVPSEKRNGQRSSNDRPSGPINPMVAAGIAREARFAGRDAAPG
jgi:hypothetical protein